MSIHHNSRDSEFDKTKVRHREISTGQRPLPNLLLRSVATLGVLYGLLSLLLITAAEMGVVTPTTSLIIGVAIVSLQFVFGPWILDLSLRFLYTARWVDKSELPTEMQKFVDKVCKEEGIRFPDFAIIEDGAPQAFTYGHYPNNARIVISRGTLNILSPAESNAVVAHELGHVCRWDMVVMTIAQLVPLLAYFLYKTATEISKKDEKGKSPAAAVAVGAYVVYIISQYVVLWFSRTREYYADQFAGEKTGDPNALARALVAIGYGLASGGSSKAHTEKDKNTVPAYGGALGAMNIFDRRSALGLVVTTGAVKQSETVQKERVKDALQWDLWNPWAKYYEIHSTHPLIAKRLERLGDQAIALRKEPYIVFDRKKPESYWDEFIIDIFIMLLPIVAIAVGILLIVMNQTGPDVNPHLFGWPLCLFGIGSLIKTLMSYRAGSYPQRAIAEILGEVKVSPVRTIPVTLKGTIIGKGVPGLLYSEDFVMQDETGIIFLDYRQPIPLWDFFFGLLRAGKYQDKNVEVKGWFRRAPVPYLEINTITSMDDNSERRCYTKFGKIFIELICIGLGTLLLIGGL